jgi:hypothetical protein
MMVRHAPVPEAHAVQAPLQLADAQQKPSLHAPVEHSAFDAHAPPGDVCATHAPALLQ